jgi:hypothetical protein
MTRLEAIDLFLEELRRHDPAGFELVMRQVLGALGYADRIDEAVSEFEDPADSYRTLH